jgi:hypothetical protein
MTTEGGRGRPALLVVGQVLEDAAKEIAGQEAARACLKIRSGEHLAAIFLCGLFGCAPSAFDLDGGPDLVFDSCPEKSWFPYASPRAFEIKSLPGSFRKQLDLLLRSEVYGREGAIPFPLRIWTAAEVMQDAHSTLAKAELSLIKKTPPEYSRNVFLVTHPADHLAVDVMQSLVASHLMPSKVSYESLDSVWVYWPPDKLVMWSKATQTWIDIIFAVDPEAPFADDKLSFIQNIELTYITAAGINASPYVYNIEF